MDKTADIDELLSEINRRLPLEQRIRKDDPIYAGIVLNKVVLEGYTHLVQKALADSLHELAVSSEQQLDRSEAIASRLILKGGNNIEKQLDAAALRWEERLRKAGEETETAVRQAAWLAWAGGCLIVIWACTVVGSRLGTDLFTLVHHVK